MKRSLTSSEGELPIAKNNMFLYIEVGIVVQPQIRYRKKHIHERIFDMHIMFHNLNQSTLPCYHFSIV